MLYPMYGAALQKIRDLWEGPAITLDIAGVKTVIGNGTPRTTMIVPDKSFITRLARRPSMAFGEAYMNAEVTIKGELMDILQSFYLTAPKLDQTVMGKAVRTVKRILPRRVGVQKAIKNAQHHYDVGNEFYKLWLDPTLAYTCAYFKREDDSLEIAQRQKFDLVCQKARLEPGMSVIDLGCGWGGLLFHAVENYGVHGTGVVAAQEQAKYIREEARRRGLSDKINVTAGDWRQATGTYDRVLSVGLMEHVGKPQYKEFMQRISEMLKNDGIAFIHTIGRMVSKPTNPWITTYIFPDGFMPTETEIIKYGAQAGMNVADVENLWQHYAKTLAAWSANFKQNWSTIVEMYDEPFARMYWLYLQGSEAAFRWGDLQLFQTVFVKSKSSPWPLDRQVDLTLGDKLVK